MAAWYGGATTGCGPITDYTRIAPWQIVDYTLEKEIESRRAGFKPAGLLSRYHGYASKVASQDPKLNLGGSELTVSFLGHGCFHLDLHTDIEVMEKGL